MSAFVRDTSEVKAAGEPWSETSVIADFWHNDERTTYELVHRSAGYDTSGAAHTRWIPEGFGVRWRIGMTYSQFWYKSREEATAAFTRMRAQAIGG